MKEKIMPGPEAKKLLQDASSHNMAVATAAQYEIAKAFETPIRQAVLNGPILDNIFDVQSVEPGKTLEYPLDIVAQTGLKNHTAYTLPYTGAMADRYVEATYLKINTFDVGNSIDCAARLLEIGSWDIMKRLSEVLALGFTQKMNDDGWRVLLAAAYGRGISVVDTAAPQGYLTKKLVRDMKSKMMREGGGNSSSTNLRMLTDLYLSIEALDDMSNWDLSQISDQDRHAIYVSGDGEKSIFGVKLHPLFELGVGQAYQNYAVNTLGFSMTSGKEELVVGLSLNQRDSFVWASEKPIEVFEDPSYHRARKFSMYGWTRYGVAALDSRPVLFGQI